MLSTPRPTLDQLRDRFGEAIVTATDAGWDAARASFNLVVDQRPRAVALPGSAVEAARIVAAIRDVGLRIAPQGSAHNPIPLGSLEDTVIVKLDRLTGVEIDTERQVARVEAGARWWDVVPKAAEHGLSVLHGSSPEINVVGYSLGGGVGWQARKRGLQANSITAIEIVTADGEHRVVDAGNEPELFWALRGGGGNFGLVTAIEFRLYPLREVYAGSLFFPYERSGEVFHAWREWTASVPEEVTSAVRMLQFPDLEIIPEIVRGGSFAVVGAAVLGDAEQGGELLRPLRELGAQTDTFAMIPAAELTELHMDPVEPLPYVAAHSLLGELPAKAVDELIAASGPGSDSTLGVVELRHLGGALGREEPGSGALSRMNGEYLTLGLGAVMSPEMAPITEAELARFENALAPYDSGRYLNFTEVRHELEAMFPPGALERLRAVKELHDPAGLFRANHAL